MERDVSVASAAQIVPALRARGHSVTAFDAAGGALDDVREAAVLTAQVAALPPQQVDAGDERLIAGLIDAGAFDPFDVVFLALHGGAGENGTVQGLFERAGICFTGTGQRSSALAMDKNRSKRVFRAAGIPTADWVMAGEGERHRIDALGMPLIVKPNAQGSTVGLTLVQRPAELDSAIAAARAFDAEVMLERFVPGRELTVGVLDGAALSVGEIIPAHGGLFDYASKYQAGGAAEVFPAEVGAAVAERTQQLAVQVSDALNIECYCRVDFRLDPDEALWCLEANTLPGLTAGSLLPRSAAASGIEFAALCERICELALARHAARR